MTETTKDLLARLTGFCEQVGVQKCPCGHKSCSQYTLATQRSVGFALEDADLYAAAPDLHRELAAALAREAALLAALTVLVNLNENHSPFGGEIYQDRVDRAWDTARALAVKS